MTSGTLPCPPQHEVQLGRLIDDGIHGQRNEIHEHDFGDRFHATHRHADRHARGWHFPAIGMSMTRSDPNFSCRPRVTANVPPALPIIFPEQNNARVPDHDIVQRLVDRVGKTGGAHGAISRA